MGRKVARRHLAEQFDMSVVMETRAAWRRAFGRYLALSLGGHLAWEILQLPLYTIWSTAGPRQLAFAVLHCTAGDVMIAALSLLAAIALAGRGRWPGARALPVCALSLAIGVAYTIFSEWLNVDVRGSWSYSALMPTLPVLGTGLAPLLQWLIVPPLAQLAAIRLGRARCIEAGAGSPCG